MRTAISLSSALLLATLGAFAAPTTGCSTSGESTDSSEANQTADDLSTARDIVKLLAGDPDSNIEGRCSNCHGVTAEKIRSWGTSMKTVDDACFAPATLSAADRVNCLRSTPGTPTAAFSPRRLGLYAAAAKSDQFKNVFTAAFPGSTAEYSQFLQKASMPREGDPLTADEFAKVKDWVLRGMPQLDQAFAPEAAPVCNPSTTPELRAHIAKMKTEGWGARLADQATPMFGCNGGSALDCMANITDATPTFGAQGVTQKLRQLHKQSLQSHWWVRSSADGRYVGYGLDTSAKIVDLTKPEGTGEVTVAADYDPYFLPSNDGFAFAGSHDSGSIVLCRQSVLSDAQTAAHPSISLAESKCAKVGDDVYMSIGTALDGQRYFMTFGTHENDDGGNEVTRPLPANFSQNARTTFTPMVNNGLSYQPQRTVSVSHPKEGNMMLSPSSQIAALTFGDGRKPKGYRVRFIQPQLDASGAVTSINAPVAAEVCMSGQKPNISFDERFLATHQYVDTSDSSMAGLPDGSSNILVADLATGRQVRITTSAHGVFALYPHFRADGWLYFAVRDMNTNTEYLVASDIALRMAAE